MALTQSRRKDLLAYLFLLIFLVIAYFPVSSFLFALKNDAITVNFPNKYFFSAALHAGQLPLWNPYVNFGLPLYADMGFAFWQPITWVFGVIGYNIHTLAIEVLVYIWLGGIFMYELGNYFQHPKRVSFCMGAIYMCSGFFIGNFQHINFLTCAAFLPLVTKTFLQLQEGFDFKRLLCCILSLYLLATGGHPAIPIATAYFLAIVWIGILILRKESGTKIPLARILKNNLLLLIGFLLTAGPLLYSYFEILPYLNRSKPVLQSGSLDVGFSVPSYISFLFPFATTSSSLNLFENSELMRNGYFSCICLALFIVALFQKKNIIQKIFLVAGAAMLLLSLGGPTKAFIYPHLPFLQYIRTNGEFRVFSIFSFIIVASFPFSSLMTSKVAGMFHKILRIFIVMSLALSIWVIIHPSETLIFSSPQGPLPSAFLNKIKWWLDNLTLYDRLLINAVIVIILLTVYLSLQRKRSLNILLPAMILSDMFIFCWLHLPVTGVQKRSAASIESYFSSVKAGIPVPLLIPIKYNKLPGENLSTIIGCWSYYSKQPGTPEWCNYPTLFSSSEAYFRSPTAQTLIEHPFVFLENEPDSLSSLTITKFSPDEISIQSTSRNKDNLVLLQNYYPSWHGYVNNQPYEIQKEYQTFMKLPIQSGKNEIRFRFEDEGLPIFLFVSFITLLTNVLFMINEKKSQSR